MNDIHTAINQAALGETKQSDNSLIEQCYRFKDDFIGFQGHFPGYPILPAFIQILLAQQLADTFWEMPIKLIGINKAKFLLELKPNQKITVICEKATSNDTFVCKARLMVEDELAASFLMTFGLKDSS
jgi:3-hydroxyacyl-[acyl-carrier-protein] dehydratase